MGSGLRLQRIMGFNVYYRGRDDAFNFEVECNDELYLLLKDRTVKGVAFITGVFPGVDFRIRTDAGQPITGHIDAGPELVNKLAKEPVQSVGLYIKEKITSVRPTTEGVKNAG